MKNLFYQLVAAITFFTRIPLWRIIEIPAESFPKIICFWPLTGWISGGITAASWFGFSMIFHPMPAIILALVVRVLLTGGLHEDGLGDFFDGFGGGKMKEDILRIMKDSHAGSYALIGLILYYLLFINTLVSLPKQIIPIVILVADPLSKFLTGIMMNFLPYARAKEDSKVKTIFEKMNLLRMFIATIFGLLPMALFIEPKLWLAALAPVAVVIFIYFLAKRKINGYTGDICGATALLCELSFYLGFISLSTLL